MIYTEEKRKLSKDDILAIRENYKTPSSPVLYLIMVLFFLIGIWLVFSEKYESGKTEPFVLLKMLLGLLLMGTVIYIIVKLFLLEGQADKDINSNEKTVFIGEVKNKSIVNDEGENYFILFKYDHLPVEKTLWDSIGKGDIVEVHKANHTGFIIKILKYIPPDK